MRNTLLTGILIFSVIAGCSKGSSKDATTNTNNNDLSCTGTKSFATDVNPIFQSICSNSGCHDAASVNGPGPLTTYQQVFNARTAIRTAVSSGIMPKNTTLTATQKTNILCWIDNGALNN